MRYCFPLRGKCENAGRIGFSIVYVHVVQKITSDPHKKLYIVTT